MSCSRRCAQQAGAEIVRLQAVARRVATLDVLATLADVAEREQYVRPELHDGFDLAITAGRHPVVERMMAREKFIPNDLVLTDDARLIILTGPNMAGKSTILRQIGLIQLHGAGGRVRARAFGAPAGEPTACSRAWGRVTTSCAGRARSWWR